MKSREEILEDVRLGIQAGVITETDLKQFVHIENTPVVSENADQKPKKNPDRLSAVDIMFYIAGLVFFSTIMSIIIQSWGEGSLLLNLVLTLGVGSALWTLAYNLIKSPVKSDIREGITNSMLLTGSLSIVTGGYILTNELIGGFDEVNFVPFAFTLLILGAIHIAFDKVIKRDLIILMGILLGVASFPTLLFGFLENADLPADAWSLVFIASLCLLVYATRVIARMNPHRLKLEKAFDLSGVFLVLATMYLTSFSEYGIFWLIVLLASVFGIFYLSIISQDKNFLGVASFFLTLTVITISFRYFSGYGSTISLIMATLGLLGTAAVASSINKKYFKTNQ